MKKCKLADYHQKSCLSEFIALHSLTHTHIYIYVYVYVCVCVCVCVCVYKSWFTHNWDRMSASESEFIMLIKHTENNV